MIYLIFAQGCTQEKILFPPEIDIDSLQEAVLIEGSEVDLSAVVSDQDNDNSELEVRWKVNDDVVCPWAFNGVDCTVVLMGTQVDVSAQVRDPDEQYSSDLMRLQVVENQSPVAQIDLPSANGRYYSDLEIEFSATASDAQDSEDQLSVLWTSSLDGELDLPNELDESGQSSGRAILSQGDHVIGFTVEDPLGQVVTDTLDISVFGANQSPVCSLVYPEEGQGYVYGEGVFFSAEVNDLEEEPQHLQVVWSTSLSTVPLDENPPTEQGVMQFLLEDLAIGTHQLTLEVKDERGASCVEERTIFVATPPTIVSMVPQGEVYNEGTDVPFSILVDDQEDSLDQLSIVVQQLDGTVLSEGHPTAEGVYLADLSGFPVGGSSYRVVVADTAGLTAVEEGSLTINGLPSTPVLSIDPEQPATADSIQVSASGAVDPEGGDVVYRYEWHESGNLVQEGVNLASELTNSSQTWTVWAYPSDGLGEGIPSNLEFEIQNTPPDSISVTILPETGRYNDSELTCSAQATDIDQDDLVYTYSWTASGTEIGAGETLILDGTISPETFITCEATAFDPAGDSVSGSTAALLINRPPVIDSLETSHTQVHNDEQVTCSALATDPDGVEPEVSVSWLLNNSETLGAGETLILSDHRPTPGSTLSCVVVATDEYGGSALLSSDIDILNRLPQITGVELSDPLHNSELVSCMLTTDDPDLESLEELFLWRNITQGEIIGDGAQLLLNPSLASVGDEIRCEAMVSDFVGESDSSSSSAVISNRPPSEAEVSIIPFPALEGDPLTCIYSDPEDPDGEEVEEALVWLNGNEATQEHGADFNQTPLDGASVTCQVELTDPHGAQTTVSDTVVIGYIPPSVESLSLPSPAYTNTPMIAELVLASDEVAEDLTYKWYVDGNIIEEATSLELGTEYYVKAQEIRFEVYLGTMIQPVDSVSVVIQNAPPSEPTAILNTVAPQDGQDELVCSAGGGLDPDVGDEVRYSFRWNKNGSLWSGCPLNTATNSTVPASAITGGDEWICTVLASDGEDESSVNSDAAVSPTSCFSTECEFSIPLSVEEGLDFLKIDVSEGDPKGRYTLSSDFYMMSTEVTAEQYFELMGYNPSFFTDSENLPVGNINWHETASMANTLTAMYNDHRGTDFDMCYSCSGIGDSVECSVEAQFVGNEIYNCSGFRMPTEAEWELAARSGTTAEIWTGHGPDLGGDLSHNGCDAEVSIGDGSTNSFLEEYAWFCGNDFPHGTKSVGMKSPNGFGLYDMHGNVWEWCHDWYGDTYPITSNNPIGPESGHSFVLKGGRWGNVPNALKVSVRSAGTPHYRDRCVGARIVRSVVSISSDVDVEELCSTDELCENGFDEDYDSLVDCEDPDCSESSACVPAGFDGEEDCTDGVDDEGDLFTDCEDPECEDEPICAQGGGQLTASAPVCDLFDGCLATTYGISGASDCMTYIRAFDLEADATYEPWISCMLTGVAGQVGSCGGDDFSGCNCQAAAQCDAQHPAPSFQSTDEEPQVDCDNPQLAGDPACQEPTQIDCTNPIDWCDASCLTECNDPPQDGDPDPCFLCEDQTEDTAAPSSGQPNCNTALTIEDDNYCHPECLTLDAVDCENDPLNARCQECYPGSGHHAEDGAIDCDDVSSDQAGADTSSACDASYEEACMAYCHWVTNNQDPDFYNEIDCYYDSCNVIVEAEGAAGNPWFECMALFTDPQDGESTAACDGLYVAPFLPSGP